MRYSHRDNNWISKMITRTDKVSAVNSKKRPHLTTAHFLYTPRCGLKYYWSKCVRTAQQTHSKRYCLAFWLLSWTKQTCICDPGITYLGWITLSLWDSVFPSVIIITTMINSFLSGKITKSGALESNSFTWNMRPGFQARCLDHPELY